ncbi:MAG: excisionase family DNA-binding protein [Acidimicrobiia bacterium]
MNLKEAALRLGVHYQTAYKWVRSGQLTAVRVGGRYEVSDAAIERFRALRRTSADEPIAPTPSPTRMEPEDLLEALEAMAMDPFVTLNAVATLVARRGAVVVGDVCLVAHCDEADEVDVLAVDHLEPEQAASLAGALVLTEFALTTQGIARTAYDERRTIRVPHVPQDWIRRAVRPELLQHLALHPIHGLLVAPVIVAGKSQGALVFLAGPSRAPYSTADEEYAQRLAAAVAALFETAAEVRDAWAIRELLVAELKELVATRPEIAPDDVHELVRRCARSTELPVAVLDRAGRIVAINTVAGGLMDYGVDEAVGLHLDTFTHPDELAAEHANFDRLRSGELDYLDVHGRRMSATGTEFAYASQRAAVRAPDASLRYVVSVARPLHIPKEDYGALWTEPR